MKTTFKKLTIVLVAMLVSIQAFAVKHVVEKGETIESIAQKYGTTAQAILQANPEAESFIYVGMELNIPETGNANYAQTPMQNQNQAASSYTYNPGGKQAQQNYQSASEGPGWYPWGTVSYGFLSESVLTGAKGWSLDIAFGGNYWQYKAIANDVTDSGKGFFAGAGLAYNSASTDHKDGVYLESHFIRIPVHGGYAFTTENQKFAIIPTVGLDANFCISSKLKAGKESAKVDKEIGLDAKIGASIRLYGFNINAFYYFPLNDDNKLYYGKDAYFSVGIGWGF